jgi:UDP-N-acetylglucosamine 2-epimerase (non-hydrolysing)
VKKILIFLGTRPEVIKMAPLVLRLKQLNSYQVITVKSGQHTDLFDDAAREMSLSIDLELQKRDDGLSLSDFNAAISQSTNILLQDINPDIVLVHGDTLTSAAVAITSFLNGFRVGHVEAGLRSNNLHSPFPEEGNRRLIDTISTLHFPPTEVAAKNLAREQHLEQSISYGNTVVDALHYALGKVEFKFSDYIQGILNLPVSNGLIFVTQHRRESFGSGLRSVFSALRQLADNEFRIIFPVHPNPNVRYLAEEVLSNHPNVFLVRPLGYFETVHLMKIADLIITDSGGIQEEASIMGVPTVITREVTERPEVLDNNNAVLVGSKQDKIFESSMEILTNQAIRSKMSNPNPLFGDGRTSERIASSIDRYLKGN